MRLLYLLLLTLFGVRFTNGIPAMSELWEPLKVTTFERLPDGFELVSKQVVTNEEKNSLFIEIDLSDSTLKQFKSSEKRGTVKSVLQMLEQCFPGFVARIRKVSRRLHRIRLLSEPPDTLPVRLQHIE